MFTNQEIMEIAMKQSALDLNAQVSDFTQDHHVLVMSEVGPLARKYYIEPIACNLVSYGSNIVASVRDEYRKIVEAYIQKFTCYHCFETPNLYWLNEKLEPYGQKVCFQAEYFLPDINRLNEISVQHGKCSSYEFRILEQQDFTNLYDSNWSNALSSDHRELDILGVGAYDGEQLIGLAACSADCDTMWQIGVDVLPAFRRQGIASSLTSRLAMEILNRGRVPFYCCAWSNIRSAKNAYRAGFVPAWAEMTVKPIEFVKELNQETCEND